MASVVALALVAGCGADVRRFPVRAPVVRDTDLDPVSVACRAAPTAKDPRGVACMPKTDQFAPIWTAVDRIVFEPAHDATALPLAKEAMDVNSMDEVPDSAWFQNRIGAHAMTAKEVASGACTDAQWLHPDGAKPESWLIDGGKSEGSSPGFRVTVPGQGKYMFKGDDDDEREVPTAASVIGTAVYHAAGFHTACEQVLYVDPAVFRLKPGLTYAHSRLDEPKPLDAAALRELLSRLPKRGKLVRMGASAWIPGRVLGPYRYDGTRDDDPNDVIPHQERRELRGSRLLAAWIDRVDARDANTLDTWIADDAKRPESSPGHVVHYTLDTSDALGPEYGQPVVNRRLGFAYVWDWGEMATDFVTLGVLRRPWDEMTIEPEFKAFRTFDVKSFAPEQWKMQYANPAFDRMTERDAAWMARILSRFTPEMIAALTDAGRLTRPHERARLAFVLEGRLARILDRWLTRLSPLADVHLDARGRLCGDDRALARHIRDPAAFRHTATLDRASLHVEREAESSICVTIPHVAEDVTAATRYEEARYVIVRIENGVARGPLLAHLYDFGPTRGYQLVGLERPES